MNIALSHKLKAMVIYRPDLPEYYRHAATIENAHHIAQLDLLPYDAKQLVSISYSFAFAEEEPSIPRHVWHAFEKCIKGC